MACVPWRGLFHPLDQNWTVADIGLTAPLALVFAFVSEDMEILPVGCVNGTAEDAQGIHQTGRCVVDAPYESNQLDGQGDAFAAADAQGGDAAPAAGPFQTVQQRDQHPRPAATDRVAQRDGAP